ncbi:MAG: hypothetical protein WBW92_11425 [Rhodanobacteraceae bacterium]
MAKILPFKASGMRPLLREACSKRQLVRVWRDDLEAGSYCGYVGAVGHEFFMLWVLGDNLAFDGIHVLRQRDITDIEVPDKHHEFLEKAIALNGLKPDMPDSVDLDSVRAVIDSIAALSPVMSLRVDNDNPDETDICYVGRVVAREDDGFSLQEITPQAEWLREPSFFAWDEISTVCFNDPYATILAKVAGEAPQLDNSDTGLGHVH